MEGNFTITYGFSIVPAPRAEIFQLVPASFTLQLKKGNLDIGLNKNRRLLNTEKLIFKTENLDVLNDQGGMHVLVTVEPEGVVAMPNVEEREFIFNIGNLGSYNLSDHQFI
ncbi:protein FAR1-RELATED SEQUENCE [Citrus sinensis]|nr:protein FAR1-RELATED SEQUENCE [Citrus sinensis]